MRVRAPHGRRRPTPSRLAGNELLRSWCAGIAGDVLSVGSGDDSDRNGRRYRDYFKAAATYTTSDIRPGCDLVLDLMRPADSPVLRYDAIFCHSVLEHVEDPPRALTTCAIALRPGGALLVGVPFAYRIHRAPADYWRFTGYGLRLLLECAGFVVEDLVGIDGEARWPAMYWARARKS